MSEKLNQAITDLVKALEDQGLGNSVGQFLEFKATTESSNYGKGIIWTGQGATKQFVYAKEDKLHSTENISLAKDRSFIIDGNPVISATEIGPGVTKSNLRQVGRLKGLIVDGDLSVNQYLHYNSVSDRLGLGTDTPNAALSVSEDGIEVIIGTTDSVKAKIGTHASHDLDIVTDSTPRITVEGGGNIKLGNRNFGPIQVAVHGKMSVNVKTIDTRVDLHVAGGIKFNERIHQYAAGIPEFGTAERGDIIWNSEPELGKSVGWVCVRSGSPGGWLPFGEIKN